MKKIFDLAIIGGGINGCGIAAEAATRGLSVILIEKDDLASQTSSKSSKLIHGGLRYLEQYQFKLVRKALKERRILSQIAAHLVHPLPFVIPYQAKLRPYWWLRLGLYLYDYLYFSNGFPKTQAITAASDCAYFSPLKSKFKKGFLYYDAKVMDSRLTLAAAQLALEAGGLICTQTELVSAGIKDKHWVLKLKQDRKQKLIEAKVVINATGSEVSAVDLLLGQSPPPLSLVKGSHIWIEKIFPGSQAYLLQHKDNRIIFVIPYAGKTLIGTTDLPFTGDLEKLQIDEEEKDYLLSLVNHYFRKSLAKQDIIGSFCGLRSLIENKNLKPQDLSREYYYQLHLKNAPLLSIYSGKITTYRKLATEVVDALQAFFPRLKKSQSHKLRLPGSEFSSFQTLAQFKNEAKLAYPWLPTPLLKRYLDYYGQRIHHLLAHAQSMRDLGQDFGHGLYQREVDYLIQEEWVRKGADLLERRTNLGLVFSQKERKPLEAYINKLTRCSTFPSSN